jgi:hypothetical protein
MINGRKLSKREFNEITVECSLKGGGREEEKEKQIIKYRKEIEEIYPLIPEKLKGNEFSEVTIC